MQLTDLFLLTGANLGERLKTLQLASHLVEKQIGRVLRKSRIYKTEPWGMPDDAPAFLNQALHVMTPLEPSQVLEEIHTIEMKLGRVRHTKWQSRVIDIDIALYGDQVISNERLTIPHHLIHERNFALYPLAEIAGNVKHPVLKKTLSELLRSSLDTSEVSILDS